MGVVETARSKIGAPYVWGAEGPDAFDCSGFVKWSFAQNSVSLPHFTDAIAAATPTVRDPTAGDLIFYEYSDPAQPGVRFPHMGIVVGGGQTIDCAYPAGVSEHAAFSPPHEYHRVMGVRADSAADSAAAPLQPDPVAGAFQWASDNRVPVLIGTAALIGVWLVFYE